jgi:hypothetical protein
MPFIRPTLLVAVATSVAACSESETTPPAPADSQIDTFIAETEGVDTSTTVDAGAEDTAADTAFDAVTDSFDASDSADAATDSGVSTVTLSLGAFSVPASTDVTNCAVIAVGNTDARLIRRARIQLAGGMQEVAIYRGTGPAAALAGCPMFGGLSTDHLLLFGHSPDATLSLPDTSTGAPVGLPLAGTAFLRVELHAFNASSSTSTASATLTLETIPTPTNAVSAGAAVAMNTAISLPPGSGATVERFQTAIASTSVFAMTMHTHALGTSATALFGTSATDPSATIVYTSSVPSEAALTAFAPVLAMPAGSGTASSRGFTYRCAFMNTRSSSVSFGTDADEEQCMMLSWYYPSIGFQLCVDGTCTFKP